MKAKDYNSILSKVSENGFYIRKIDFEDLTQEICLAAIRQNHETFQYIPPIYTNEAIRKAAVESSPFNIIYIQSYLRTEIICWTAVHGNGEMLEHVPMCHKSMELCVLAVLKSSWAIRYVPEHLRDREVCRIAYQSREAGIWKFIPSKIQQEIIFEIQSI